MKMTGRKRCKKKEWMRKVIKIGRMKERER